LRQTFVVNIENGLHARPCAALVKALRPFKSDVTVEANDQEASGHSIMGLMALAAGCGCEITFAISGNDAARAMAAVRHLFDSRFEESRPPLQNPQQIGRAHV
jgi:phosphotransferase system HPr (HPr) family protein